MTRLCSQTFIAAESFMLPVEWSSVASSLRAARLLSSLRSFIKSTIDLRQSRSSGDASASLSMTAAISTWVAGDDAAPPGGPAAACAPVLGEAGAERADGELAAAGLGGAALVGAGLAAAAPPKIDDMMLPNTDIFCYSQCVRPASSQRHVVRPNLPEDAGKNRRGS